MVLCRKNRPLEFHQYLQENNHNGVSFFIISHASNFIQRKILTKVFSCKFGEIFKSTFSQNDFGWQLWHLHCVKSVCIWSFLFRIFPHSNRIRRFTLLISQFSPIAGKYGPENLQVPTFFTQYQSLKSLIFGKSTDPVKYFCNCLNSFNVHFELAMVARERNHKSVLKLLNVS